MTKTSILFPTLEKNIRQFDFESIPAERRLVLQPLVDFIQAKATGNDPIRLNLICTHNSRRSHLSQVWGQTAAHHYGIPNVACYSGGTEATAMFAMVGQTLQNQGFEVMKISEGLNPVYAIKFAANEPPVIAFSKKYDAPFNPETGFAAIMTCSQADSGCPFIAGAETRIPITFEDPKAFDGRPQQAEKYAERSLQMATEMFYVFSKINN